MRSIFILSRTGSESRLFYAIPALLNANFQVGVFTENIWFLKNSPPDVRDRTKVFCVPHKPTLLKSSYLRLIREWIKMKRLKELANSYDLVFNVRAMNLYDPILSPAKVIYHLYEPMITHWHAYKIYPRFLMRAYFALLDGIWLNRLKRAVVLANSYYTQRVVANKGIVSEVVYPPCKIDDLEIGRKRNQVISVARIAIEKKHENTIRIARYLPNVKFIILGEIGDLTYYYRLKELATSNINIVTPPHEKFREFLRRYLSESKIYLHLADDEPFGITVVEAMASGCVPIVPNAGGPSEIVTKEAGLKWNSIKEAVTQISLVLSSEELRKRISSNAVKRAQAFTPEVYQRRIMEIIQKL